MASDNQNPIPSPQGDDQPPVTINLTSDPTPTPEAQAPEQSAPAEPAPLEVATSEVPAESEQPLVIEESPVEVAAAPVEPVETMEPVSTEATPVETTPLEESPTPETPATPPAKKGPNMKVIGAIGGGVALLAIIGFAMMQGGGELFKGMLGGIPGSVATPQEQSFKAALDGHINTPTNAEKINVYNTGIELCRSKFKANVCKETRCIQMFAREWGGHLSTVEKETIDQTVRDACGSMNVNVCKRIKDGGQAQKDDEILQELLASLNKQVASAAGPSGLTINNGTLNMGTNENQSSGLSNQTPDSKAEAVNEGEAREFKEPNLEDSLPGFSLMEGDNKSSLKNEATVEDMTLKTVNEKEYDYTNENLTDNYTISTGEEEKKEGDLSIKEDKNTLESEKKEEDRTINAANGDQFDYTNENLTDNYTVVTGEEEKSDEAVITPNNTGAEGNLNLNPSINNEVNPGAVSTSDSDLSIPKVEAPGLDTSTPEVEGLGALGGANLFRATTARAATPSSYDPSHVFPQGTSLQAAQDALFCAGECTDPNEEAYDENGKPACRCKNNFWRKSKVEKCSPLTPKNSEEARKALDQDPENFDGQVNTATKDKFPDTNAYKEAMAGELKKYQEDFVCDAQKGEQAFDNQARPYMVECKCKAEPGKIKFRYGDEADKQSSKYSACKVLTCDNAQDALNQFNKNPYAIDVAVEGIDRNDVTKQDEIRTALETFLADNKCGETKAAGKDETKKEDMKKDETKKEEGAKSAEGEKSDPKKTVCTQKAEAMIKAVSEYKTKPTEENRAKALEVGIDAFNDDRCAQTCTKGESGYDLCKTLTDNKCIRLRALQMWAREYGKADDIKKYDEMIAANKVCQAFTCNIAQTRIKDETDKEKKKVVEEEKPVFGVLKDSLELLPVDLTGANKPAVLEEGNAVEIPAHVKKELEDLQGTREIPLAKEFANPVFDGILDFNEPTVDPSTLNDPIKAAPSTTTNPGVDGSFATPVTPKADFPGANVSPSPGFGDIRDRLQGFFAPKAHAFSLTDSLLSESLKIKYDQDFYNGYCKNRVAGAKMVPNCAEGEAYNWKTDACEKVKAAAEEACKPVEGKLFATSGDTKCKEVTCNDVETVLNRRIAQPASIQITMLKDGKEVAQDDVSTINSALDALMTTCKKPAAEPCDNKFEDYKKLKEEALKENNPSRAEEAYNLFREYTEQCKNELDACKKISSIKAEADALKLTDLSKELEKAFADEQCKAPEVTCNERGEHYEKTMVKADQTKSETDRKAAFEAFEAFQTNCKKEVSKCDQLKASKEKAEQLGLNEMATDKEKEWVQEKCGESEPPKPPIAQQEDCIAYDHTKLSIEKVQDHWSVKSGNIYLLKADTELDAKEIQAVATDYKNLCFIGRGNNRPNSLEFTFMYWKGESGVKAIQPSGVTSDCIGYKKDTLKVEKTSDYWAVKGEKLEGKDVLDLVALDNENDAKKAVEVMKNYSYQCFVGRDNKRADSLSFVTQYFNKLIPTPAPPKTSGNTSGTSSTAGTTKSTGTMSTSGTSSAPSAPPLSTGTMTASGTSTNTGSTSSTSSSRSSCPATTQAEYQRLIQYRYSKGMDWKTPYSQAGANGCNVTKPVGMPAQSSHCDVVKAQYGRYKAAGGAIPAKLNENYYLCTMGIAPGTKAYTPPSSGGRRVVPTTRTYVEPTPVRSAAPTTSRLAPAPVVSPAQRADVERRAAESATDAQNKAREAMQAAEAARQAREAVSAAPATQRAAAEAAAAKAEATAQEKETAAQTARQTADENAAALAQLNAPTDAAAALGAAQGITQTGPEMVGYLFLLALAGSYYLNRRKQYN